MSVIEKNYKAETIPNAPHANKIHTQTIKTLKIKAGLPIDRKSHKINCGEYVCKIKYGGKPEADLVMFNIDSIEHYQTPPAKTSHVLWVFQTTEPQWLQVPFPSSWNGMFNYSVTYLTDSANSYYNFRDRISYRKKIKPKQFSLLKGKRSSTAVWFVSHCDQSHRKPVTSARDQFVFALAQYIQIDVFTKKPSCKQKFKTLIKNELGKNDPSLKSYTFYLAFENSLCKDYITEKLWKVLEDDNSYTIPVVLGGLSVDEYRKVAPPNSFIHIKNFTSVQRLAEHLKFVADNDAAYNYYMEWRNKYLLSAKGTFTG